jgi:hypothetical protein
VIVDDNGVLFGIWPRYGTRIRKTKEYQVIFLFCYFDSLFWNGTLNTLLGEKMKDLAQFLGKLSVQEITLPK